MGIKHRSRKAGRGRTASRRKQSQTRLESERRKNERTAERRMDKRLESQERRDARKRRSIYGSQPPPCPDCGAKPKMGQHSSSGNYFWACSAGCDTSVGCHPDSTIPLGRMGNAAVRAARSRTHTLFDMLWANGRMERAKAYELMAESMGLPLESAHIGMFDLAQCEEAAAFARLTLRKIYAAEKPESETTKSNRRRAAGLSGLFKRYA